MAVLARCVLVLCAAVAASSYNLGPSDVVFHLYTRNNPQISQPMLPTPNSIMTAHLFSLQRKTIFLIHSFGESVSGNMNAFIVPGHLASEDVNVIAVDWSSVSTMYSQGLANAPEVGRVIASFINILTGDFSYNNEIRIVGHGLGGHIAGIAARNTNVVIPHIIALDPSFHGWTHNDEILSSTDATTVEVLHTTIGQHGYDHALGTIDFYANGGLYQPPCFIDFQCGHMYAYIYYAESLDAESNSGNQFVGTACNSYDEAISSSCTGTGSLVFGGTTSKSGASGIYWFSSNASPPFAQG